MIAGNGFANALESIFGTSVKSISGGFALHVRDETFTPEGWSSDVYDTGSFTIHAFDLTAGADIRQLFAFADQSSHLSDAIAAFAAAPKSDGHVCRHPAGLSPASSPCPGILWLTCPAPHPLPIRPNWPIRPR